MAIFRDEIKDKLGTFPKEIYLIPDSEDEVEFFDSWEYPQDGTCWSQDPIGPFPVRYIRADLQKE